MRSSNKKEAERDRERERKIVGGNTDKGVEQTQRHYKKFACSFWHLWLLWQVKEEYKPQVDREGESKMVWERESKWERVSELK